MVTRTVTREEFRTALRANPDWEPWASIGTTLCAMQYLDPATGEVLASAMYANPNVTNTKVIPSYRIHG